MKLLLLLTLFISSTFAQEVSETDPYHMERVNARISQAYQSLLRAQDGDPRLDCYRRDIVNGLQEATWLWEDISEVLDSGDTVTEESSLFDIVFSNFDRLLDFSSYFNMYTNDPNMLGAGIYTLYTFAELVSENGGDTQIDQETMKGLLQIITNEPFNLELPPAIFSLIDQIEYLEVRKDNNGETVVQVHNIDNRKITMGVQEFMAEGMPNSTPFQNLIIKNNATFTFNAQGNDRDEQILELVDRVQTTSDSDLRELGQEQTDAWLNSLADRERTAARFSDRPSSAMRAYIYQGTSATDAKNLDERYQSILSIVDQIATTEEQAQELEYRINEMQTVPPNEIVNELLRDYPAPVTTSQRQELIEQVTSLSRDLRQNMEEHKINRRPEVSESDQRLMREFVSDRDYEGRANASSPIHFRVSGVKASFRGVGAIAGVGIREGAILPGVRHEDTGELGNSVLVKAGGTGIAAIAGSRVIGM